MAEQEKHQDAAKQDAARHQEAVKQQETAKKELEAKQKEQLERMAKSKPTPTQDENDRAKLGEHITKHEDDGSGPDPHAAPQPKK